MVLTLTIGLSLLAGLVAVLAAPPLQEEGQDYIVVADDWLSKLAEKYLGNAMAYPAIVEYTNQKHAGDASYAEITDPDLIEVGWKIYIPSAEEADEFLARESEFGCKEKEDDASKIVRCWFPEGVTEEVLFEPITVTRLQYLQLTVFGKNEMTRTHFVLGINQNAYPQDSGTFTLMVKAIPTETIAANYFEVCQEDEDEDEDEDEEEDEEECGYRGVVGLTDDGRLIIRVDSGEYAGERYVAASPYAFSVTGIHEEFENPVSVSISVDRPEKISRELWEQQEHGIIIHHEGDGTEHFTATQLITQNAESGFYLVTNSDSITRCCAAYGHCSSGPTCLKCE